MLSTGLFETRSAKLIACVVAVLLLAVFQAAMAKPAHAWKVHISITGAGQVTETTPANLLGSACATSATNPTGVVGKDCYAGTPTGEYGSGWTVRYVATAKPGYSFVRWQSDGSTRTSVKCDGANGSDIYTGSACQFATWENLQTRAVFADTTAPPKPTISNGPLSPVNGPASFTLGGVSSDPTFLRFECRVVGVHDWQTCTSPTTENPPNSGTYTLDVRAVDWSGNTSATNSWQWTVDKTPPGNLQINSFPPSLTNNTSATFTFSSNDPSATYLCSLDSGIFVTCTSPKTYTGLLAGAHSFSLTARDSLGNTSGSIISRSWTIDLTPPDTTLDPNVGPTNGITTQDNDPVFAFSSSASDLASFECNLQGPGFTSTAYTTCTSPKGYPNLKDGTYTFKVRAKDTATNVDASPAELTWTILNRPTVLTNSLTPLKGATGVSRTTMVQATFSEAMAPTSITNSTTHVSRTFTLKQWNATRKVWKAVPATVILSNGDQTATLDPFGATETGEKALAARTKFKATITTGATDASGNPLAKTFTWTFTTGRR
jgi:hypothetical protein